MKNSILSKTTSFIIVCCLLTFLTSPFILLKAENPEKDLKQAAVWMKQQPVQFLENKGQMTDMAGKPVPFVLFKTETPGMNMYITEKGLTYVFIQSEEGEAESTGQAALEKKPEFFDHEESKVMKWNRIDMALKGASIKKENIITENASQSANHYYLGHSPDGIRDVHSYGKVTITNVYPGIDWVFYNSTDKGAKYDFVVHPGADPKQIQLVYSSSEQLKLDTEGNLIIKTDIGTLTEGAPFSYIKETAKEVSSPFKIINEQHLSLDSREYYQTTVTFDLKSQASNHKSTLVIDPQLFWATYYGGNGADGPVSITTDNAGNVFITGYTWSPNFPIQDAGTFLKRTNNETDVFIVKFSNTGVLLWATFYGGDFGEGGESIATDDNGNVFVTGETGSANFPVQDAGTFFQGAPRSGIDIFILKFDNAGNRLWATYYGGSRSEYAKSIATDGSGNVFITGQTLSSIDFPLKNAGTFFQGTYGGGDGDAFILKFDNTGNSIWATYYGGSGWDYANSIATDGNNNALITGFTRSTDFPMNGVGTFQGTLAGRQDAFIFKFNNEGNCLWTTYYGGTDDVLFDGEVGNTIAADASGNVFVLGYTSSLDFPVIPGPIGSFFQDSRGVAGSDAFILKFDSTGNPIWATYYGGLNGDDPIGSFDNLTITLCGSFYVSFRTASNDILTQPSCDGGYYNSTYNGSGDYIIAHFSNTGVLLWSTYLRCAISSPITVDNAGNLFVSGERQGGTYPLADPGGGTYYDDTHNGGADDGFMVKFSRIPLTLTTTATNDCGCTSNATVNVTGGCAPYQFLWSNGQTTQTATGLCGGNYTVTVIDTNACISGSASVTITPLFTPTSTFTVTGPLCPGDNSTITYTGNGTTSATYNWSFDGGTVVSGAAQGPYAVNWATLGAKNITLAVTESGCTSDSTTQVVTVNPIPTSSFTVTSPVCPGANSTITYTGTATASAACTWDFNGGIIASGSGQGPYSVNWTTPGNKDITLMVEENGCISALSTQTVTVTPPDDASFTYAKSTFCQTGTNPSPTVTGLPGGVFSSAAGLNINATTGEIGLASTTLGTYTVTYTTNGPCPNTGTFTVTVTLTPDATFSYDGPYCQNQNTDPSPTFPAGSSAGEFSATPTGLVFINGVTGQIDLDASAPGTYTVTNSIAAEGGCPAATATSTVTITRAPDAKFNFNGPYCQNETIDPSPMFPIGATAGTFSAIPAGLVFINDSTGQIDLSSSTPGTYTVTNFIDSTGGCPATSYDTIVTIYQLPVVSFAADVTSGCSPLCVDFTNTTPNEVSSSWNFGDGNASSISSPTHCYNTPGLYSVSLTVTDTNGCSNTTSTPDMINVYPVPTAAFTAAPQPTTILNEVQFTDLSTDASSWFWSFGNGTNANSTLQHPKYTYTRAGHYEVMLAVESNGCLDTTYSTIIIDPPGYTIYIPNSFTPDNDGLNDFFAPQGVEFTDFEMSIFNRWGEEIYHTNDIDKPWNGKSKNGNGIQKGVYVYKIWVKDLNEEIHYYVGNVSVIK